MDLIEYFLEKYKIIQKKYIYDSHNQYYINQYIDNIYVINLVNNPVRREYIKLIMKKMKINYTIIVVQKIHKNVYRYLLDIQKKKKISQGEMGIYLSHMWCLRNAIQNNHNKFIILEDDILFHKNFHKLFEETLSIKKYDFLMLGASHFNRGDNYYPIQNKIYRPSFSVLRGNLLGAFATLYSKKGAEFVYELRKKNITYFDYNLYEIFKHFSKTSGICYPNLIIADISHSNLNHSFILIGKKKYYNNCYDTIQLSDYHFTYIDMFMKYKFNHRKHMDTTPKKALIYLLLNFFNNNIELVKYHITLLDWDLFSLYEINKLIGLGEKKKEDYMLYKNNEEICKTLVITHGYLLASTRMQFRYFCLDFLPTLRNVCLPDFSPQSKLETILVEYRILPHIEFLIRNIIVKLGGKWSHTVVCGDTNYKWMTELCKSISSKIRIINTNHKDMTRDKYSIMLMTKKFWEQFNGEKLLLYQEDSCCFHGNIESFLKYDWVCAPWDTMNDNIDYTTKNIGNGGFSLRSKKVMVDICTRFPIDKHKITQKNRNYMRSFYFTKVPEDRYFSEIMNTQNIGKICDWYTGVDFSEETYLNSNSLGGHQFWLKNHDWKTRMFKLHYDYNIELNNRLNSNQKDIVKKHPYLFHKVILGLTGLDDEIQYKIQKKGKITKKRISHLHCYNIDEFDHFYDAYLYEIYSYTNIIITYCIGNPDKIKKLNVTCLKVLNKGMDIGGKFCAMHYLNHYLKRSQNSVKNSIKNDIYILFLHSKSNNKIRKYWFDNIISNLKNIKYKDNLNIGGYFPPAIYSGDNSPLLWFDRITLNHDNLERKMYQKYHYNECYMKEFMKYLKLEENDMTCFPGGNCYILKYDVANKLFSDKYLYNILNTKTSFDFNWFKINYNLDYNDIFALYKLKQSKKLCGNNIQYKSENNSKTFPDAMIEHTFERLVFLVIKSLGLNIFIMPEGNSIEHKKDKKDKKDKNCNKRNTDNFLNDFLNNVWDEREVYSTFSWREKLKNNPNLLGEKELKTKLNVWNSFITKRIEEI
jgi:GR25 family glycosyltransferase involved in LPS biosynthesis